MLRLNYNYCIQFHQHYHHHHQMSNPKQLIGLKKAYHQFIHKKCLVGVVTKKSKNDLERTNDLPTAAGPLHNPDKDYVDLEMSKLALFHKPSRSIFHIPAIKFQEELKFFNNDFPTIFHKQEKDDIRMHLSNVINENIKNIGFNKSRLKREKDEDDSDNVSKSVNDLMWKEIKFNKENALKSFLSLSKIRLTSLVVMTTMAGYAMAPGLFDPSIFLATSLGVLLTSAAANATNQFFEVPYDSQMSRTMNRPIVRGLITPPQAVAFAVATCTTGVAVLYTFTNTLTALLGFSNVLLYTLLYTPMKRTHIANTWVGAVVGAVPPIMGWSAATGGLDVGAILMGSVLYAWQFPHFCALSWNLQGDYSRAGYRMMSVIDPDLCKRVSLRYSASLIVISLLFPYFQVTTWTFAMDSLPLNFYLTYLAWNFYKKGDSSSSRKLFRFSLVHLPLLLVFMIISKKRFGNASENKADDSTVIEQ